IYETPPGPKKFHAHQRKLSKILLRARTSLPGHLPMPRPSHLSTDNILRFLQVRSDPASADDIASALHMRRADRRPLFDMLNRLKKRRVIEELPGGRYRLSSRKPEGDNAGHGPRGAGSQGQAPSRTGA